MTRSTLDSLRLVCQTSADAIRWACVLEATAPKPGNVWPGKDQPDLSYADFVQAAELTASQFNAGPTLPFSQLVVQSMRAVMKRCHTNVNLGILLLIGPLYQAESIAETLESATWQQATADCLARLNAEDAANIYAAISAAKPGGMGQVDDMDVHATPPADLVQAMRLAADRDRIALNYSDGFTDFFANVLPVVDDAIRQANDVLEGIVVAQLRLLAKQPDSLIERKYGTALATEVQHRAQFDPFDLQQRCEFDRYLRAGAGTGKAINPGTTADFLAASLYVLLRQTFRESNA